MPRYIEEDAIRQGKFHLNYLIPDGDKDDSYWYQCGWNGAIDTVLDCLPKVEAVPLEDYKSMERTVNKLTKAIADAEPVRHGRWIFKPKDAIEMMFTLPKCSECGAESPDGGNYCPNCGARMDEVSE